MEIYNIIMGALLVAEFVLVFFFIIWFLNQGGDK